MKLNIPNTLIGQQLEIKTLIVFINLYVNKKVWGNNISKMLKDLREFIFFLKKVFHKKITGKWNLL